VLLYKYCGPGGLAVFESCSIFLTRPTAFNDPFDVNPYIAKFSDIAALGAHLQRKARDIVVLSLAENYDSLLMWAHYTAQHKGFLIGFDSESRILARPTPTFSLFGAVSYCHHRPTGDRFTDISDQELYFRKSSEWAYEKEWRLVETVLTIDGDPEDPKAHWSFALDPDSIRTVVVGYRSRELFPRLYELLRQERYAHVELHYVNPDLRAFRLNIEDWPRNRWQDGEPPPVIAATATP
jgi:hypothetical protein